MKLKLNFKSFNFDDAATWLGAIALSVVLLGVIYGVAKLILTYRDTDELVELQAIEKSSLYEAVPNNNGQVFNLAQNSELAPLNKKNAEPIVAPKDTAKPGLQGNPYALWSYGGDTGPTSWHLLDDDFKLCAEGEAQSPVNINSVKPNPKLAPLKVSYGAVSGSLNNDGRLISFMPNTKATVLASNQSYMLKRVDFHTPSEHRINNQKFDLEVQLVHVNQFGETFIIALLAKEAQHASPILAKLLQTVPDKNDQPADVYDLPLESLLPKTRDYYYYEGSLTAPPCREKVLWAVIRDPIVVSAQQIDRLLSAAKFNARPLQKISGRTIFRSW